MNLGFISFFSFRLFTESNFTTAEEKWDPWMAKLHHAIHLLDWHHCEWVFWCVHACACMYACKYIYIYNMDYS